jgi:hypothetical protein
MALGELHFGVGDSIGFGTSGSGAPSSANTASFNISALSNIQVGDLLVAWIHNQSSALNTSITAPGGWTRYGAPLGGSDANASNAARISGFYYYPIVTQSDITNLAATHTWTFSASARVACVVARATGIDLAAIPDSAATSFNSIGNSTFVNLSSLTTIHTNTLLIAGVHHQNSAATSAPATTSLLSSFQEYRTDPTGAVLATTGNTGAAMGFMSKTSAGATSVVTANFSSSTSVAGGELVAFKVLDDTPPVVTRPTIIGTATTYTTSLSTLSFTIAKPSGCQDGDVLIMALSAQSPTATSDFTSPGWSRIGKPFLAGNAGYRVIGFHALPVPSAAALTQSDFTFTSTDSSAGGRICAEVFIVRGVDLTNMTSGFSDYAPSSSGITTVPSSTTAVNKNLLLVAYNSQCVSGVDYSVASGPAGMTQQNFMVSSTTNTSKTTLAVYQKDIEAGATGAKTITWAANQSQASGVAVMLRAIGEVDPNAGVALKYTSATDTLSTAHLFYTSATDTLSTPLEVRPMPTGYPSVTAMLATAPFYVAHRGGSKDWPEMSLYSYSQSAFWGVGALEISLARTSDGVWFGLHDSTLDRTSGLSGYTASAHTWAEIQAYQITAGETNNTLQPTRPYMRWEELMTAYYNTHVIFVDPKVAAGYATELLNMMDAMPGTPTDRFVAKYYGVTSGWPTQAKARGYKNWGYFYQADAANFDAYQGQWDILGMDYTANSATWTAIKSYGKPVIGHIVPTLAAATTALGYGANGLMVSGVQEAIPRKP